MPHDGAMSPLPPDTASSTCPRTARTSSSRWTASRSRSTRTPRPTPSSRSRSPGTGRMGVETPDGALAAVHGSFEFQLPVPGDDDPLLGSHLGGRPPGPAAARAAERDDRHPLRAVARARRARLGALRRGARDLRAVRLRLGRRRRPAQGSPRRRAAGRAGLGGAVGHVRRPSTSSGTAAVVDAVHRAAGAGRPGWITRDTPEHRTRVARRPARLARRRRAAAHRHGARRRGRGARLRPVPPQGELGGRRPGRASCRSARPWRSTPPPRTGSGRSSWTSTSWRPSRARCCPPTTRCCSCSSTSGGASPRLTDNLWVRLLDLPVALAGRRYSAPLDVVLDVTDTRLPANAGRWRLTTGDARRGRRVAGRGRADRRRRRPDARRARARRRLPRWAVGRGTGARRARRRADARCAAGDGSGVRVVRRAGVQLAGVR